MDLVVGLGEIGKPIKSLLEERGYIVQGWDITNQTKLREHYDFIHICFPGDIPDFDVHVIQWKSLGKVIIHSTVRPETCERLGVVFSPVRGVHSRMLKDLKRYKKYYSGERDPGIEERFQNTQRVEDSTKLEYTKIIVDTTYYGILIAFRKYIDSNYDVDWSFAEEINDICSNRPVMYNDNKPIGGHCVLPNLDLIDDEFLNKFIKGL